MGKGCEDNQRREENPGRRRGRRLPGKWPYFFLAPFLAGFFAAAFFVAIGTPPPFSFEISFVVMFHIAEIAPLVKFFFSFFFFSTLVVLLSSVTSTIASQTSDNFASIQRTSGNLFAFRAKPKPRSTIWSCILAVPRPVVKTLLAYPLSNVRGRYPTCLNASLPLSQTQLQKHFDPIRVVYFSAFR
jgi:hypothetical protein